MSSRFQSNVYLLNQNTFRGGRLTEVKGTERNGRAIVLDYWRDLTMRVREASNKGGELP